MKDKKHPKKIVNPSIVKGMFRGILGMKSLQVIEPIHLLCYSYGFPTHEYWGDFIVMEPLAP
jgi:hypothetical protein